MGSSSLAMFVAWVYIAAGTSSWELQIARDLRSAQPLRAVSASEPKSTDKQDDGGVAGGASGACCWAVGCTDDISESVCEELFDQGDYLGDGTTCETQLAACPTGACCESFDSCIDFESEQYHVGIARCENAGGTFQGAGTRCADTTCSGACCWEIGCTNAVAETTCEELFDQGVYLGNGTTCETQLAACPTGACCESSGSCIDFESEQYYVGESRCENAGGTFMGAGTICAGTSCVGACCELNGCTQTVPDDCTTLGAFQGVGTECAPVQPCCFGDGTCEDLAPVCCAAGGGTSAGAPAASCTAAGNCCLAATDTCEQLDPVCCVHVGGIVDDEPPMVVGECPPSELTIECDQPIPPFEPQFFDNCDANLEPTGITLTAPGDCPQERTIDRDAGARDSCGNAAQCVQVVHVVDTTAPVVICPEEVTFTCLNPSGFPSFLADIPVSATDNCDIEVPFGVTFPEYFPPTCDEQGTPVVFSATDDCGNTGYCTTLVRVIGGLCCPSLTDTDLKLMVTDLDLRQDNEGPGNTKARFDIWNSNEVRFSGTERCIICWDETLISDYGPIANHLIIENLQTDKGKARIQNEASTVCPGSTDAALLGVAIEETQFLGSPYVEMRSAATLVGMGEQAARIQYDIIEEPEEANDGSLVISQVPGAGTTPTQPSLNLGNDTDLAGGVSDNRASTTFKGSLVSWPVIEVKWDANGTLIQDTFITIVNDNPGQVKIQFYQVNGDAPLDPVIDQNSMELIERGHPGWNWSDYQITLTGDESAYWSVATGLPKGVSPISVLDSGNPNGRPDLDSSNLGGRVIRGFLVGWAVNDNGQEIRWNHLKGHAIGIRYDQSTAYDYNPWNFRVVSGVVEGAQSDGDAGNLNLDGVEYDYAPESLLFDFFAAGTQALSHPAVRDGVNGSDPD